jgi:hypothetical protein
MTIYQLEVQVNTTHIYIHTLLIFNCNRSFYIYFCSFPRPKSTIVCGIIAFNTKVTELRIMARVWNELLERTTSIWGSWEVSPQSYTITVFMQLEKKISSLLHLLLRSRRSRHIYRLLTTGESMHVCDYLTSPETCQTSFSDSIIINSSHCI